MMYEEFNQIAGFVCEPIMYEKEIEPTYMAINRLEKKQLAVMYWGLKKGAYGLWIRANDLYKEKICLDKMVADLHKIGFVGRANGYVNDWEKRCDDLMVEVKAMMVQK